MSRNTINCKHDHEIEQDDLYEYNGYLLKKEKIEFKKRFVVLYEGNFIYYKNE